MHSDLTLDILDKLTTEIGEALRGFSDVICPCYVTRELPREAASRERAKAKRAKMKDAGAIDKASNQQHQESRRFQEEKGSRKKMYNINTYKHHSLGDYVQEIRERGTTDSYSTEPVSFLSHSKQILQRSDISCSFYNRESLNIELRKPDTKEPIKSSLLSNLLGSKGARCACGGYKENIFQPLAKQSLSIEREATTITLGVLKRCTMKLVHFCSNVLATQRSRSA